MLSIVNEFNNIIEDETEDYDLRDFLKDQCSYGQTVFIYYDETTGLYDKYEDECKKWLNSSVEETGLRPWELFPDWDYAVNSKYNKWCVVVAMFEEYCNHLLEGLEN